MTRLNQILRIINLSGYHIDTQFTKLLVCKNQHTNIPRYLTKFNRVLTYQIQNIIITKIQKESTLDGLISFPCDNIVQEFEHHITLCSQPYQMRKSYKKAVHYTRRRFPNPCFEDKSFLRGEHL